MPITRFSIAKPDILSFFDALHKSVFKRADLDQILSENREFWRLAKNTTVFEFIEFLAFHGKLKEVRFEFPNRNELRYYWEKATDLEIIQSLRPESYFTHFTALALNQLTNQIPKTIFLNSEQAPKDYGTAEIDLKQDRIDYAFRNRCRVSKTVADFKDKRVCLVNGKYTGQKSVIDIEDQGVFVKTTDIERTLIDCTVRPIYSGGVHSVLQAFRAARDRVSINKLTATLESLNYIYPYHQAIGFYLERAGNYSQNQIRLLNKFKKNIDFYLDYAIKEREFSAKWRINYPKGM